MAIKRGEWRSNNPSVFVRRDGIQIHKYGSVAPRWLCVEGPEGLRNCHWRSPERAMDNIDQVVPLETWDTGPIVRGEDRAVSLSPLDHPEFGKNFCAELDKAYEDDNPKTAYGDKKPPLHLVPPALTLAAAGVFKLGARKYGPYNWREKTVSSSVYQGAAMRHLLAWWDGEDTDPESGESHLAHAAACIGILLDAEAIGKLNDNRPPKGAAAEIIREKEDKS